MTGFGVNHQELADTATKTDGKATEAEGIQQKLNSANGLVPENAWGLLGHLAIHHAYTALLGTFQDHVSNMIQGVHKLADDISATADSYRQNEESVAEKFEDIENELGDAPQPPTLDSSGTGKAG